jgi:hypothetical protein
MLLDLIPLCLSKLLLFMLSTEFNTEWSVDLTLPTAYVAHIYTYLDVPQFRQLNVGFSLRSWRLIPGDFMLESWWLKWHWSRYFSKLPQFSHDYHYFIITMSFFWGSWPGSILSHAQGTYLWLGTWLVTKQGCYMFMCVPHFYEREVRFLEALNI